MRAVLTSLVLCAGLAAAAVSAGCSQGGAGVADGLQTKPAATAAATEASPTVVWRTGHAHEYRFEVVSTATVTGAVPTRVVARGTLEIVPRQRANDVELALRVTKATIELSGGADAGPGEELGRALESAPFAAALTRGSITALRVARDTPELVINLQRTLMSALQFSVSTEEAAGSWNAEEWDSTGRYRARYAPGDAAGLFQRDKLEYKAVARGGSVGRSGLELAAPVIDASRATIQVRDHAIHSVVQSEKLTMALGNSMGLSSVTSVELTSTSVAPASMDWSRLEGRTISQPLDHAAPSSRRGSAFDADRIGELTFDSALALVERQAADPNSDQVSGDRNGVPLPGAEQAVRRDRLAEQQRAFMALSAILRAEPGHVADLVSVIRRDTPARDTLISILGAAGGAQPQAALIALVDDAQYASPPRGAAALALSRIDEPTAEAVRALADLAAHPTLREYGLFGLGTLSRRVRGAGDVKLADQAGALLMGQLASATDTADRVRVLRGLANAGLAAALPELQALVSKSEDEAVRGAAIEAMRLIADPAVDDALAQFLATEDRGLRTAALRAADRRESTLVLARALEVVALTAKRAHERSAAVKVLGEWRADLPELRTTLERVAKTDSESRIRAAAQGFLSD